MHVWIMQQLPMPQVSNVFYPFNTSLEEEMKRLFTDFTIETQTAPLPNVEDIMEEFRHNGRDFEYCPDLDNGTMPVTTPRRKKNKKPLPTECVFCRNNGEEETYYRQHLLKDIDGKVSCPVLRAYTCPKCGACGDEAHTVKYCPKSPKGTNTLATANAFKLLRNSMGRRRIK
ncbi:RNA-binding protein nanos isoform X1 [Nomia melanderi]|uniref:RNA-binding protein nanos isoform X1 n=1 Tax=Nomia melanderi TaxID=2448451 RepID=UPI0013042DD1|nr:nanos homolog 3 isoform X1 [Nomia melanderi]